MSPGWACELTDGPIPVQFSLPKCFGGEFGSPWACFSTLPSTLPLYHKPESDYGLEVQSQE